MCIILTMIDIKCIVYVIILGTITPILDFCQNIDHFISYSTKKDLIVLPDLVLQ